MKQALKMFSDFEAAIKKQREEFLKQLNTLYRFSLIVDKNENCVSFPQQSIATRLSTFASS